jgi:hypothetical protein
MRRIDGITYFTVEESAVLLGITARTIQRWLSEPGNKPKHAPDLTPHLFPDGKKYFKQEDIRLAFTRALGAPLSDKAISDLLESSRPQKMPLSASQVAV